MPRIVFDIELFQPGCILLQADMGGTVSNFSELFPSNSWLVYPTPNMVVYEVTDEQLERIAQKVQNKYEGK